MKEEQSFPLPPPPPADPVISRSWPSSYHGQILSEKEVTNKRVIFWLLGTLFLFLVLAGGGYFALSRYNRQLTAIAQGQNDNLDQINRNYQEIVTRLDSFNQGAFPVGEKSQQDFPNTNVLGDYDINIEYYTQLSSLFRRGQTLGQKVTSDNNSFTRKVSSFMLVAFYGDRFDDLIADTSDYGQELVSFFSYLVEVNNISLEIFQSSTAVGEALEEAIVRGLDNDSLLHLQGEINKVEQLAEKFNRVYLAYPLPEDLDRLHIKNKENLESDLALFRSLSGNLLAYDLFAAEQDLNLLYLRAYQENQTALANELAFWRTSQTMARLSQLSFGWKDASQEIASKFSLF